MSNSICCHNIKCTISKLVCCGGGGILFFAMLHIGTLEYPLFTRRLASNKECNKAEYLASQYVSRMKVSQKQISIQNQLLSDRATNPDDIELLHPISLKMLQKKHPICPFYSQITSGKQNLNLIESTLDEDLISLDEELTRRHSYTMFSETESALSSDNTLSDITSYDSFIQANHVFNETQISLPLSLDEIPEGVNSPSSCFPHRRTAIIVPYRNRHIHLKLFLRHMHKFMAKQDIEYGIYIINMAGNQTFNRAKLLNIGFKEALRHHEKYDCFIFHDVDLLPEADDNLYTCNSSPKHMSVAIDIHDYKLPYDAIFGGVTAMTPEQFVTVNGYSNLYWGWGGEDDDMYIRIQQSCMSVFRIHASVGRYHMATHTHDKGNEAISERFNLLKGAINRRRRDGLMSLKYKVLERNYNFLYNNITVDIGAPLYQAENLSQIICHLAVASSCIVVIYVLVLQGCNKRTILFS